MNKRIFAGGGQSRKDSLNPCKIRENDRISNIIFKDVKEFNIILLILIGLFLVSISGYSSYAIFTDEIVSNNEIKGVIKSKSSDIPSGSIDMWGSFLEYTPVSNQEGTVNVIVMIDREEYINETVTTEIISNYLPSGQSHLYNDTGYQHTTQYTVADALIAAFMIFYGNTTYTEDEIKVRWLETESSQTQMAFEVFDGVNSIVGGNYYYIGKENNRYNYYWEGNTWLLSLNDSQYSNPFPLVSAYELSTVNKIVLDYSSIKTEKISTPMPLKALEPSK